MSSNSYALNALCVIAERMVGVHEDGDNRGAIIESIQKSVNPNPNGESWCADFCWYCIDTVTRLYPPALYPDFKPTKLFRTESVIAMWTRSPSECKTIIPQPGAIICWQLYKNGITPTALGHCGIVLGELPGDLLSTVEGNTSPSNTIDREGDGIYLKQRHKHPVGSLQLLGYLLPF